MPQIDIDVHEDNSQPNDGNKGTFVRPHPKVNVGLNAAVNWHLVNQGATFEVKFSGFKSPFSSNELSITTENARNTDKAGVYHYAVKVTKTATAETWEIANCPELDVG